MNNVAKVKMLPNGECLLTIVALNAELRVPPEAIVNMADGATKLLRAIKPVLARARRIVKRDQRAMMEQAFGPRGGLARFPGDIKGPRFTGDIK